MKTKQMLALTKDWLVPDRKPPGPYHNSDQIVMHSFTFAACTFPRATWSGVASENFQCLQCLYFPRERWVELMQRLTELADCVGYLLVLVLAELVPTGVRPMSSPCMVNCRFTDMEVCAFFTPVWKFFPNWHGKFFQTGVELEQISIPVWNIFFCVAQEQHRCATRMENV